MFPVLIEIPQFGATIHTRGLLIVLAALLCNLLGARWIESLEGIDRRRSRAVFLWLLPAAFIGGRLHWVANQWSHHAEEPLTALVLWGRGMHAGGAIIAIVATLPVILRRLSIPIGKFADGAAPAIALSIAIARLGCFARGCCYGADSTWPWAVRFPPGALAYTEGSTLPAGTPLHPLQLYFALAAVLIAGAALYLRRFRRYEGQIGLLALLLFSLTSAVIEPFRAEHPGRAYWWGIPQLEWTALAMLTATTVALAVGSRTAGLSIRLAQSRRPGV